MERILQEIEHALKVRLYYLAFALTLALPDLCAALESPTGASDPDRYKAWYRANMATLYPWLTGDDCYKLRCGVVHHGRFGHPQMQYGRVVFVLPGNGAQIVNSVRHDAYFADLVQFCVDATQCVRGWFAAKQSDQTVQKNAAQLMQVREKGMPPFGSEMAVIS